MKHIIFRLLLASVIVIVMVETPLVNALFMLFVAGTVPGTDYVVPANAMMLGYCTLICAILVHIIAHTFLRARLSAYLRTLHRTNKKVTT